MRLLTKFQILFVLSAMLLTSYARADFAACTMGFYNKGHNLGYAKHVCNSGTEFGSCVIDILNSGLHPQDAENLCADKKVTRDQQARQDKILNQMRICENYKTPQERIECMRIVDRALNKISFSSPELTEENGATAPIALDAAPSI
jgi:hypothetical protein